MRRFIVINKSDNSAMTTDSAEFIAPFGLVPGFLVIDTQAGVMIVDGLKVQTLTVIDNPFSEEEEQ